MFKNRKEAALQLAKAPEKYRDTHAMVLGIPRGGAEIAYYVAMHPRLDYSMITSRKLEHSYHPEWAIGAVAEDGSICLKESGRLKWSQHVINALVAQQKKEIERRIKIFRKGKPLPQIKDKTVILVDEGIATGATLYAAIDKCKRQGIRNIVIAAPVSSKKQKKELQSGVDKVVTLQTPEPYHSIWQVYHSFTNLTDDQTLAFVPT